jgi:acyl-CoA reductase-like NAD-dependent aldehyde dehydrogenase
VARNEANLGKEQLKIKREPHGIVFVMSAWNYPCLISVNSLIAALASGNAVLFKHSSATLPCAERIAESLHAAGVPLDAFKALDRSDW